MEFNLKLIKLIARIFPLAVMLAGAVFFSWNAYSFYIGYSSSRPLSPAGQTAEKQGSWKTKKLNHPTPELGEKIGELSIPKLKEVYPIYQGTTDEILKKGAGHVVSTALPGELNHSVISGHRDTIFRGLRHLVKGDKLFISTGDGTFLYKVVETKIVKANNKTILTPKPRGVLSLTTCYPFYFMGNAPDRYIVVTELMLPSKSNK